METLTAYVRKGKQPGASNFEAAEGRAAVLTVLKRRKRSQDQGPLNLRAAGLGGLDLANSNLLRGADLQGAMLLEADLTRADLQGANPQRAYFGGRTCEGPTSRARTCEGPTCRARARPRHPPATSPRRNWMWPSATIRLYSRRASPRRRTGPAPRRTSGRRHNPPRAAAGGDGCLPSKRGRRAARGRRL
jgi:hypothetical protein